MYFPHCVEAFSTARPHHSATNTSALLVNESLCTITLAYGTYATLLYDARNIFVMYMCRFPYLPEAFMSAGIHFANFAWEDMTTPPLPLLADIVRVLASHLAVGGKVSCVYIYMHT
jgi:hypothetical protein